MSKTTAYREDIQALRALSVLLVVLFHYDANLLPGGFIGVDVFFVISGYLITRILQKRKAKHGHSFKYAIYEFYIARTKRIIPAYYVMLLFVGVACSLLLTHKDFQYFNESFLSSLVFWSNQYFANFGDYFGPSSNEQPLLHTWSLAVEMQFYLVYPIIILGLSNRLASRLIPTLLVLLVLYAEVVIRIHGQEQQAYFSTLTRIPEFLAGAMVSQFRLTGELKHSLATKTWYAGLMTIIVCAFWLDEHTAYPGLLSLLPTTGACLMLLSGKAIADTLVCSKPVLWVGALSYSLYLWHWPVLAIARYYTNETELGVATTLVFAALTITLSSASYYLVESKFNAASNTKVGKLSFSKISYLLALLLSVATLAKTSDLINSQASPKELAKEYLRYADPTEICHGKIVGQCMRGDSSSNYEVLALGDSHVAMLNHFFDHIGEGLGFKARVVTASSCIPIETFDYRRLPEWAQQACIEQIAKTKRYIEQSSVLFIGGKWSYHFADKRFESELAEFFDDMSKSGKQVYILPQVPLLKIDPLRARRLDHLGLPLFAREPRADSSSSFILPRLASKYSGVNILPLNTQELFESPPVFGGELIYFDKSHLNERGAHLYALLALESFEAELSTAIFARGQ